MKIIDSIPFKIAAVATAITAVGIVTVAVRSLSAPSEPAPQPVIQTVERQQQPEPPPLKHPVEHHRPAPPA